MLIYRCNIFLAFIFLSLHVECDNESWRCTTPNVGTVIFNERDLSSGKCWSREEISVLYSRYRAQSLLPNRMISSVEDTIDYLVMCFETTQSLIGSKTTYVFIIDALSDTFGGYMHVYGLPVTKKLFYEGNVSVGTAMDAFDFHVNMMHSLNTDGQGWAKPIKIKNDGCPAKAFDLQCKDGVSYCDQIYMNEGDCRGGEDDDACQQISMIPMPMVDNSQNPQAVAFPIKNESLYSLESSSANGIVVYYYVTSMCCIKEISYSTELGCRNETEGWNKCFKRWLEQTFLGHLEDEALYPAFGGVLQIVRRVNMDICFGDSVSKGYASTSQENTCKSKNHKFRSLLFIIILLPLLLLLLMCCCRSCLPCCQPQSDHSGDDPESRPLKGSFSATAFCCSESASTGEAQEPCKTCNICGLKQRSDPQIYSKTNDSPSPS